MKTLAVVHPLPLVAKELRELLERHRELWRELRLVSTVEAEIGTLTETRGAAAMVTAMDEEALAGVDVAFFCGPAAANRPWIEALDPATRAIVLSPDAGVDLGRPLVAGVNLETAGDSGALVSPHPGAVALAHRLHPLAGLGVESAVATLVQPASMHGSDALDEVLDQTRSILRFQPAAPREVFGGQIAFNLLPIPASPAPLVAQLREILGDDAGELAVQVLQGGVFHGMGVSVRVRLDEDPGAEGLRDTLAAHPAIAAAPDADVLGPIDVAASDQLLLGPVTPAPGEPGAYWIWATMDNLTLGGAQNAFAILEAIADVTAH